MGFYPDVLTAAEKACTRKLLLPSHTCSSYMQKRHGKALVELRVKGSACFTSLLSHLLWETWGNFYSNSSLGHYGLYSSLTFCFPIPYSDGSSLSSDMSGNVACGITSAFQSDSFVCALQQNVSVTLPPFDFSYSHFVTRRSKCK